MASKGWLAGFSEVKVETIVVAWCSDHMTILLTCSRGGVEKRNMRRKFRYEMSLDKEGDCGKIVERVWKGPTAVRGHLNRIQQQLNGSRQELRTWSKDLVKTRGQLSR